MNSSGSLIYDDITMSMPRRGKRGGESENGRRRINRVGPATPEILAHLTSDEYTQSGDKSHSNHWSSVDTASTATAKKEKGKEIGDRRSERFGETEE
jgi:hypothetical protein